MTIPLRSLHPARPQASRPARQTLPLIALLAEVVTRHRIRRSLGGLNAAMLRDIGLTSHDLNVALALPLTRSAARSLDDAGRAATARW